MFIIDGHNLLHSIQKTDTCRDAAPARLEGSESISDVGLCWIVGRYLKQIGQSGAIIFDGTGPRDKGGFDNISNLEVFFAGLGTDADTVIENKIGANTAPRRLTIVSSDRRLRKAARARKAISVKSEVFWNSVQKQLSRKKTTKEPAAKRRGLSDGETKQWLEYFGLEQ